MNVQQLENELWEAADQLRANSKLTAAEYSMPVLGLIFLRHADNRFKTYLPEIEADIPSQVPAAQRETLIKLGFQGKAAIYLPEEARFDRIASLPRAADVGQVIDQAMDAIEAEYDVLKGALPRGYAAFEPDLLAELVKIFDRPAIKAATGDVFGRIYEYFLNKFAMSGAQEGGEFFTPPSLVRMIVNVIEPAHGLVLDPACGLAGMFVQTDIKGEHFADAGTYMVLTPGNFFEKGGFRVRDGMERYYLADFPEEFLLAKGDLIVAMTEQGEGLLGSAARIPDHVKYLHNQRLGLVQVTDPALFDKRFLYWVFNSAGVRARLRATATAPK